MNEDLKLSANGERLIKAFESCMRAVPGGFKAYQCPADVLTIGWGHTNDHGRKFKKGDVWTQQECDRAFTEDMELFVQGVRKRVKVRLKQDQFDAVVSFAYNCGLPALGGSTLLKRLNAGDFGAAALEFHKWNKAKGKVLRGLVRRRASEALLFQGIRDLDYDGCPDGPMPQKVTKFTAGTPLASGNP
jgi:lysozyme